MGVVVPKVASATADATGKATFSFPAVTQGYAWTGTLSIGSAPSGAVGQVYRDNVPMLQVLGGNTSGTVQGGPGNLITISATGLSPAQQYTATWWVEEVASTTAKPPDPTQSVTQIANPETVDYLGTINVSTAGSGGFTPIGPALSQYQGFMLIPISGFLNVSAATIENTSKSVQAQWQSWQANGVTPPTAPLFIPTPADVGDGLTLLVKYPGAAGFNVNIAVYGLGLLPPNAPKLRADGRLPAVGFFFATAVANNNSQNLVTAGAGGIPNGWHALIRTATLLGEGAVLGNIGGTIAGNFNGFLWCGNGPVCEQYGTGLLLDSGTAVTCASTAAVNVIATITYDVVA